MSLDNTGPNGGDPKDSWVFEFSVGNFTDHGYYAVLNKKDANDVWFYSFN